MNFTTVQPITRNFTPSDLMREYAEDTPGATFTRDRYFTSLICKNGVWYEYDHLKILNSNPDTIAVIVYLKEKTL